MKVLAKLAFGALVLGGVAFAGSAPASAAGVGVSFGLGYPGYSGYPAYAYGNSCGYYNSYDAPAPWGLPPGYCGDQVYLGPVYWGGNWYRGPIYYRWDRGARVYWLNGGWRRNEWRGRIAPRVEWRGRTGGQFRGGVVRGGVQFRGGAVRGGVQFRGRAGGRVRVGSGARAGAHVNGRRR